jgi:ribosomal protein L27
VIFSATMLQIFPEAFAARGDILLRQKGTKFKLRQGDGTVNLGSDFTCTALADGLVRARPNPVNTKREIYIETNWQEALRQNNRRSSLGQTGHYFKWDAEHRYMPHNLLKPRHKPTWRNVASPPHVESAWREELRRKRASPFWSGLKWS